MDITKEQLPPLLFEKKLSLNPNQKSYLSNLWFSLSGVNLRLLGI